MVSMRYVVMQILTWGTVAAAAGSALLLAALGGTAPRLDLSLADAIAVVQQLRPAEQAAHAKPSPVGDAGQVSKR